MSFKELTAGQECQQAAKLLSNFIDQSPPNGSIPPAFFRASMAVAIFKGPIGVATVRLPSLDWSAPCAIGLVSREYNAGKRGSNDEDPSIKSDQETVLLFMSEKAVFSLVKRTQLSLSVSHTFKAGPLIYDGRAPPGTEPPIVDKNVDVYAYVRYNNGPTPANLVQQYMSGWSVWEDPLRHGKWHGNDVTWYDVLTNRISVDRSSVGNALYVVLAMAAGSSGGSGSVASGSLPYANIQQLTNAPSFQDKQVVKNDAYSAISNLQSNIQQKHQQQQNQYQQNQYQQQQQQYSQQKYQPMQYPQQQYQQQQLSGQLAGFSQQTGFQYPINNSAGLTQGQGQVQQQQIQQRLVELNNRQQHLQLEIQRLHLSPETAVQAYPYQQELLLVQQQVYQLLQLKQQLP